MVTTGAGNPSRFMPMWLEAGIKVIPVVASVGMAKLVTKAGAAAVIAEGGESGGHVGDLTTMVLVPPGVRRHGSAGFSSGRHRRRPGRCGGFPAGRRGRAGGNPVSGGRGMRRSPQL